MAVAVGMFLLVCVLQLAAGYVIVQSEHPASQQVNAKVQQFLTRFELDSGEVDEYRLDSAASLETKLLELYYLIKVLTAYRRPTLYPTALDHVVAQLMDDELRVELESLLVGVKGYEEISHIGQERRWDPNWDRLANDYRLLFPVVIRTLRGLGRLRDKEADRFYNLEENVLDHMHEQLREELEAYREILLGLQKFEDSVSHLNAVSNTLYEFSDEEDDDYDISQQSLEEQEELEEAVVGVDHNNLWVPILEHKLDNEVFDSVEIRPESIIEIVPEPAPVTKPTVLELVYETEQPAAVVKPIVNDYELEDAIDATATPSKDYEAELVKVTKTDDVLDWSDSKDVELVDTKQVDDSQATVEEILVTLPLEPIDDVEASTASTSYLLDLETANVLLPTSTTVAPVVWPSPVVKEIIFGQPPKSVEYLAGSLYEYDDEKTETNEIEIPEDMVLGQLTETATEDAEDVTEVSRDIPEDMVLGHLAIPAVDKEPSDDDDEADIPTDMTLSQLVQPTEEIEVPHDMTLEEILQQNEAKGESIINRLEREVIELLQLLEDMSGLEGLIRLTRYSDLRRLVETLRENRPPGQQSIQRLDLIEAVEQLIQSKNWPGAEKVLEILTLLKTREVVTTYEDNYFQRVYGVGDETRDSGKILLLDTEEQIEQELDEPSFDVRLQSPTQGSVENEEELDFKS